MSTNTTTTTTALVISPINYPIRDREMVMEYVLEGPMSDWAYGFYVRAQQARKLYELTGEPQWLVVAAIEEALEEEYLPFYEVEVDPYDAYDEREDFESLSEYRSAMGYDGEEEEWPGDWWVGAEENSVSIPDPGYGPRRRSDVDEIPF